MASADFARELLEHRGSLFGFLYSLVRDLDLAEELFQEVSVRMLEREQEYTPGTDFGAWARAFARRMVFEQRRYAGRLVISQQAVEAADKHFQRVDRSWQSRRKALRECLKRLDEEPRRLINLRFEHGLSMKTIGERVRRAGGTVQVALSRTRAWLMKCINRRTLAEAQ